MVVVGGTLFAWYRGPQVRTDLEFARVEYKDLQLKIVERGTLEAKENHDVKCEVKTGNRRIISYILSPLQRYSHDSLRER